VTAAVRHPDFSSKTRHQYGIRFLHPQRIEYGNGQFNTGKGPGLESKTSRRYIPETLPTQRTTGKKERMMVSSPNNP
ncbi:MAG TPA: hypothetical protein PLH79_00270, partial [bacterium]|nr:hypothetical protein [bacterium]